MPWPGDREGTFRSLSQAATCPSVYHTRWRLHTVPLIAERQAGKLRIPIFIVFGLTRPGIEPESTASVADALFTRPLIGLAASVKEETLLSHSAGYAQKKGGVVKENDSLFYYHKFTKYVDALNRGSLILPQDYLVQWCIFCVIFFQQVSMRGVEKFLLLCFLNFSKVRLLCLKQKLWYFGLYIVEE